MRDYLIIRTIAGIFFVLPCIETYQKVDLRTITLDVPPQEVNLKKKFALPAETKRHEGNFTRCCYLYYHFLLRAHSAQL